MRVIDPHDHQLEIAYLAVRRWQDELCRACAEPDPVRREERRREALRQIDECWERMMEVLRDG